MVQCQCGVGPDASWYRLAAVLRRSVCEESWVGRGVHRDAHVLRTCLLRFNLTPLWNNSLQKAMWPRVKLVTTLVQVYLRQWVHHLGGCQLFEQCNNAFFVVHLNNLSTVASQQQGRVFDPRDCVVFGYFLWLGGELGTENWQYCSRINPGNCKGVGVSASVNVCLPFYMPGGPASHQSPCLVLWKWDSGQRMCCYYKKYNKA